MDELDLGEAFAARKEAKREKKAKNMESTVQILEAHGIKYRKLSHYHFRLVDADWDIWPTTGKFQNHKTKEQGRGVFKLLKKLGITSYGQRGPQRS